MISLDAIAKDEFADLERTIARHIEILLGSKISPPTDLCISDIASKRHCRLLAEKFNLIYVYVIAANILQIFFLVKNLFMIRQNYEVNRIIKLFNLFIFSRFFSQNNSNYVTMILSQFTTYDAFIVMIDISTNVARTMASPKSLNPATRFAGLDIAFHPATSP